MDLVTIIAACAPSVEPKVMHALVWEQSGGEPWSFSVPGQSLPRVLPTIQEAIREARATRPDGSRIRVVLAAHDRRAEIAISDRGIGIPPDDIAKLGHPFVRGAGRAGTFAGMGVGLYVAKLVAEGHAGSLDIESAGDGKGTTVRVRLPLG